MNRGARRWGEQMTRFVNTVETVLEAKLLAERDPAPRIATCDLLFAVRKRLRIADDILEWRLRALLSTAYTMGAFDGTPFEMARGVGWRVLPRVARDLRAVA